MAMEARPVHRVKERETGIETFTLKDENGAVVPGSALDAATLTLSVVPTGAIVNSRNAQNVLNANNVTISEQGVVTWTMQAADVAILDDTRRIEVHRALFVFTWNGTRTLPYELDYEIDNLSKLT